jgi:hypothetical protein
MSVEPTPDAAKRLISKFFESSSPKGLAQGDILFTKALDEEIHRLGGGHLSKDVYPYFFTRYQLCVVLNATCDLVCDEKRPPKIDCVQLVALSPLIATLRPIIQKHAGKGFEFGLIDETGYKNLENEVRRIVDGQHKTRYFLPGLPNEFSLSAWTARLDVIVSIRYEHPTAFISAQTGHKLVDQRASKLAENTAALFNRIALEDVREMLGVHDYRQWIRDQVSMICTWADKSAYAALLPRLQEGCAGLSGEEKQRKIQEILNSYVLAEAQPNTSG